jgi:hypothetical protein
MSEYNKNQNQILKSNKKSKKSKLKMEVSKESL